MRADRFLVEHGFFDTRAQAQAAIAAGCVKVDGVVVTKPATPLSEASVIEAEPAHPWVSRGGVKLAHALAVFGVEPAGRVCLDVGASTGGFAHVLLEGGAAHISAVDVGRGQLHDRLRHHPRLAAFEATDIRTLRLDRLPRGVPDLIVADVSFIALMKALAPLLDQARGGTDLIALVKPQFELGRTWLGKGGLVKPGGVEEALRRVSAALSEAGWPVLASTNSPITGGDGNKEILLHACRTNTHRRGAADGSQRGA